MDKVLYIDYNEIQSEYIFGNIMKCIICNQYFKHTIFNNTYECDECRSIVLDEIDSETEVEFSLLKNPTGKTQAHIYDDNDTGDSI